MHTSLDGLQAELEKARQKLKGVEESIKKNIGWDINSSTNMRPGFKRGARHLDDDVGGEGGGGKEVRRMGGPAGGGGFASWGGSQGPTGRMRAFNNMATQQQQLPNNRNNNFRSGPFNLGRLNEDKTEERIPVKRRLGEQPQAAITVFSRLSGPPKDEDIEEDTGVRMTSQVIVQETPSRKEVLAALSGDNKCKERNKRMFGALLGTLQKFRQEENKLKEKEEKRAQVERKLEEAAQREKEEAKRTRQELFLSRRQQQLEIKRLEYKLIRLKQRSLLLVSLNGRSNSLTQRTVSPQRSSTEGNAWRLMLEDLSLYGQNIDHAEIEEERELKTRSCTLNVLWKCTLPGDTELKEWESTKVHLTNFIQTKAAPKIFFLPKVHNSKSEELLANTRSTISKMIEAKRAEVEKAIEEHMPEIPGGRQFQQNRGQQQQQENFAVKTTAQGAMSEKELERDTSPAQPDKKKRPSKDRDYPIVGNKVRSRRCVGMSEVTTDGGVDFEAKEDKLPGPDITRRAGGDGTLEHDQNGKLGHETAPVDKSSGEEEEDEENDNEDGECSEEGEISSPRCKKKSDEEDCPGTSNGEHDT
ncbi:hypothetical protein AAG570_004853 [Ranatra chinensis]|uniref:Pinin/SDK/MemA protein domain-containing protein n=1 Tax=Ranatra chinensis TaxID=642074 RepID=A0ABD0XZ24_9HEMI